MKKFVLSILIGLLLSGYSYAESNFKIVDKSPIAISFKYYHSTFRGPGRIERARNEAREHCKKHNSNVMFRGNEQSYGNWQTIHFQCVAKRTNKESYQKKKERAKAECLDFGFKAGTEKFAECVLQLASKNF